MKRPWTRGEKLLWLAPLIFLIGAGVAAYGPQVVRRQLGNPIVLPVASGEDLTSIALSRDGSTLAATGGHLGSTISGSGKVQFWDARTLQPVAPWKEWGASELDGGASPKVKNRALALSPDGKFATLARWENKPFTVETPLSLFEVKTGRVIWRHRGMNFVDNARFSPDGKLIGFTQNEDYIFLRARDGKLVSKWKGDADETNMRFAWLPESKSVVSVRVKKGDSAKARGQSGAGDICEIETRRVSDGSPTNRWTVNDVRGLDVSPDARNISVITSTPSDSSGATQMTLNERATGRILWSFDESQQISGSGAGSGVRAAKFSPDGDFIVVFYNSGAFGYAKSLLLLDASTGKIRRTLRLNEHLSMRSFDYESETFAFSPDSKRLFARGNNAVLVWDLD